MKLSKKELNFKIDNYGFEELYKYFLQNFPIFKNFETDRKRQIFFDLGKLGQICFEKQNGEVQRYIYKENCKFNLSMFPNKENKINVYIDVL